MISDEHAPDQHLRDERDREDLMREASALVERIELSIHELPTAVIIGFRRNGSGSIFIGHDPVFQFNALGQLRRAFFQGQLIKAEHGRLVALARERTKDAVQLIRHEFSESETQQFLTALQASTDGLARALNTGAFEVRRQVPEAVQVLERAKDWLNGVANQLIIADRANA